MMHSNNFVAVIKAGGKVLREANSIVHIPFGSEYTILLKNLNSVRAHAQVTIDGVNATEGGRVILAAHGSLELERFIRAFNLNEGNKFKFIERTNAVEQHRGVGAEDGLISIEFWKEIPPSPMPVYYPPTGRRSSDTFKHEGSGGVLRSRQFTNSSGISGQSVETNYSSSVQDWGGGGAAAASAAPDEITSDAGITVGGSHSSQQFVVGEYFPVEAVGTVVTLHLKGAIGQQQIKTPLTVDYKKTCLTCGLKKQASDSQFCSRCGTSLNII